MATFKNVTGAPVDIPALDIRAAVDAEFLVDDAEVPGLANNPAFAAADDATAALVAAALAPEPEPDPEPDPEPTSDKTTASKTDKQGSK